jgi:hypothetical protein
MTWSDSRQTSSDASRIVAVMETAQPPVAPAASAGGNPLGVTAAPFIRSGTAAVVDLARRAGRLGYDSFWVAEVTGIEAFSVLGAASSAAPGVGLGTGVLAMQVRTPPLLAMAAASLQALAPDREVLLGVGVSSPVVARDWHGASYPASPLAHMREFIVLLRECLSGDTVTFAGDYYQVRKFRLGVEPGERKPKIVLGALGEGMLRLAGQEADGVLLNYLPASHVSWCVEQVRRGGNAMIYANIHVASATGRLLHPGPGTTFSPTPSSMPTPTASPGLATAMPSRPSGPPTARATGPAPWPPYPTRWSTPSTWSATRHWSAKRSAHTGTLALTSP